MDPYPDEEMRRNFLGFVRGEAVIFDVADIHLSALAHACRDWKDVKFLALALAAEADVSVSSDKDLLVLHPRREVRIVTPAEFVVRARR